MYQMRRRGEPYEPAGQRAECPGTRRRVRHEPYNVAHSFPDRGLAHATRVQSPSVPPGISWP